ncbi:MAG: 16S rRNA (adenine(1518)-N(6)/adenine(1519)-N(6))-dimethyltransferase RsmA, partial [Acidobacteriota bacterium]
MPRRTSRPRLKKHYGQHHLVSGASCRPLVDFLSAGGVDPRWVVEIGPGGGVLTRELLATDLRVLAVEVDTEWVGFLHRELSTPKLSILGADGLGFPWHRLPAPSLVTGNLPFNVGTPIVDQVLDAAAREPDRLPRLGFMVQKEVADRLVARPGDPAYGALSVLVRARARTRTLGTVPPGAFRPPPKVAAAFVGFEPLPLDQQPSPAAELAGLRRVVHAAFGQRRKTLANALGAVYGKPRVIDVLEAIEIDPRRRAET